MKRITALFLCLIMVLSMCFTTCYAKEFSDVPENHWAKEYIDKLSDEGIINGYDTGEFKPNKNITRKEYIKLMVCTNDYLLDQIKALDDFGAEFDDWFGKYLAVSLTKGLFIPYYYELEDYSEPITRVEAAYIMANYAIFEKLIDFSKFKSSGDKAFSDIEEVYPQELDGINQVKYLNIINGYEDGSFKPYGEITRAEVATMIYKYVSLLEGGNR